jgi:outer membrane protein
LVCFVFLSASLFCAIFLPTSVTAATKMTLKDLVYVAVEENARVRQSVSAYQAAEHRLEQARADRLPEIGYDARWERVTLNNSFPKQGRGSVSLAGIPLVVEDPETDLSGVAHWQGAISAEYNLYDFGVRGYSIDSRKWLRDSERYAVNESEANVILEVVESYYEVIKAQKTLQIERENMGRKQHSLTRVKFFHQAGKAAQGDVARVAADLAAARLDVTKARSALARARLALHRAVGREILDASLQISGDERLPAGELIVGKESVLIDHAWLNRPEMSRQQQQLQARQAELSQHRASHLPQVDLVASYSLQEYESADSVPNYMVGVRISGPLFDGFRRNSRAQEAGANLKYAQYGLEDLKQQIAADVRDAHARFTEQQQRLGLSAEVVRSREIDLRLARKGYEEGIRSIYDLSETEMKYRNAKSEEVHAEMDLQISVARLYWAIGAMDKLRTVIVSREVN